VTDPSLERFNDFPRFVTVIAPTEYDPKRLAIDRCLHLVASSAILSQGWSWPYTEGSIFHGPGDTYVLGEADFQGFAYRLEQWRIYCSGQFVFRTMLEEGVREKYQQGTRDAIKRRHPERTYVRDPLGFVSFMSVVSLVTRAYIFASRLAKQVPFDTSVDLRVGLRGIKGWALGTDEATQPLSDVYMARSDGAVHRRTISVDAIIAQPSAEAVLAITSLFRQFGWIRCPTPDLIAKHQERIWDS
jgi:hypothetical protein